MFGVFLSFSFTFVHSNTFSQMVAEAYLSFFRFSEQTLDQALR